MRLRTLLKLLTACFLVLLFWISILAAASWRCDQRGSIFASKPQPADRKAATADIKDYLRPEDEAYLSYPEWYIVWSYVEKADYQEKHLPSGFPYFAAARQYWTSDCCISRAVRGKYSFNAGEQVMLVVLGFSFSGEYILKGSYERTVGKLSEWSSGHRPVEEDEYAAKMARDYADFVHVRPFYEYGFARHVSGLWHSTHLWGAHPIRKWERKAFLTADYTIEAFYAWLLEKITRLTYGDDIKETYAWIDNADSTLLKKIPRIRTVKQVGPRSFIVDIPRYQEFTPLAVELAGHDVRFVEIAGDAQILLSVLAPDSWKPDRTGAQQLFSTPVLIAPGRRRVVVNCEINSLHSILSAYRKDGVQIEHLYDY
ncbi:MAG TPA: hypothetical protein VKW06_15515 [Candidatus Angelobacter sp.]|nr:hypothetical protein [Candidatus Angelobacter sp.]